jgi:hypothetical protein
MNVQLDSYQLYAPHCQVGNTILPQKMMGTRETFGDPTLFFSALMLTSSARTKLVPTNLPIEDLELDNRGVKDPRYYCLPPYQGDRTRPAHRSGKYTYYLVAQGFTVGVFDNW